MAPESGIHPLCPCCGQALQRIRRSFGDRVLSLVSARKRYRCRTWGCNWQGTIKTGQTAPPATDPIATRDTEVHAAGK